MGAVVLAPNLHTGDIADPHQAALIVAAYDDVFEILNIIETSLGAQSVLKLLVGAGRRCSDGPHSRLDILLPDGCH